MIAMPFGTFPPNFRHTRYMGLEIFSFFIQNHVFFLQYYEGYVTWPDKNQNIFRTVHFQIKVLIWKMLSFSRFFQWCQFRSDLVTLIFHLYGLSENFRLFPKKGWIWVFAPKFFLGTRRFCKLDHSSIRICRETNLSKKSRKILVLDLSRWVVGRFYSPAYR